MKRLKLNHLVLLALVFTFLFACTGFTGKAAGAAYYRVSVDSGYLALRNDTAYDASNEIGRLYNGDLVEVYGTSSDLYWYVYAPSLDTFGFVNQNYLLFEGYKNESSDDYMVCVDSGYLALRNAMAYDSSNEIGKLYTGEIVTLQEITDDTYWYVYAPSLGKYGYVNSDYLYGMVSCWTVDVSNGYLALRTEKAFDSSNEIGRLYSGDPVETVDTSDSTYWYVYAPTLGKYGYVNRNYIYLNTDNAKETRIVSVDSGYLALRTAKAYDSSNEIGKLYTGDTVQLLNTKDATYWYVYSPKYDKTGFVNKNYLISFTPSGVAKTVRVSSGYLALRTAKAYDSSNEIGELYTGDTVTVLDSSDSTYWYVYSPKYCRYGYVNQEYLF